MPESLMVNSGAAFNTGQAVLGQAVQLREELDRLGREWDDLSGSWSGKAASAYTPAWQDWHEGAVKLLNTLCVDLTPDQLKAYEPGETVTEDAFTSASTDPAVANSFGKNTQFDIVSATGKDVSSFSMYPGEQEILFPPGTKLRLSAGLSTLGPEERLSK